MYKKYQTCLVTHIRIQCRKVKHLQIYKLTKIVDKRKFYKNITKVSYKNENSQKKKSLKLLP